MNKHKKTMDLNCIRKYKRSIYIDQLIAIIPMLIAIFNMKTITNYFEDSTKYIFILLFFFISFCYFSSDYFFHKCSLGKRIYRIEIEARYHTSKQLFISIILRRLMELTYNPLINRDFLSLSEKIDHFTGTSIVEKQR